MSPALAGGFLTTVPPRKPPRGHFLIKGLGVSFPALPPMESWAFITQGSASLGRCPVQSSLPDWQCSPVDPECRGRGWAGGRELCFLTSLVLPALWSPDWAVCPGAVRPAPLWAVGAQLRDGGPGPAPALSFPRDAGRGGPQDGALMRPGLLFFRREGQPARVSHRTKYRRGINPGPLSFQPASSVQPCRLLHLLTCRVTKTRSQSLT